MNIQKKLLGGGRCNKLLKPDLVTSLWYVEAIRKGLGLMPFINNYYNYKILISNILFDLVSSLYLNECNILHVISSQGTRTLQKAKKKGTIIIVDERGAHPTHRRKLLEEEYARFRCSSSTEEFFENIRKQEYELADFILVPSQYVFDSFVKMGINEHKLFIVPYGVDLGVFQQIPKIDKTFRVLYVGRVSLAKGVHYLLEAYRQLELKNAELLLIGQIEEVFKPILKKYAGIFKHISNVSNKELYKFYSNSSVFVLPSLSDSFGLVSLEAMACGLPIIVTENCGAVTRDGKDGFVIPIRDVKALKEKILTLYENEDLRQQMGNSAKEYIKNFTWEHYGQKVVQAYREIARIRGFE
jgi:glycosyltransferase involved in cell wall biosynthesis